MLSKYEYCKVTEIDCITLYTHSQCRVPMQPKNHSTKWTMVMTALVAMLAVSTISLVIAPSTAEAARRGSYVYAKMITTTSNIEGIGAEDRVYFAWESSKPLRINVSDPVTGQVTLAEAGNVTVNNNSESKVVTIKATITKSGIAGLQVGNVVTYTSDLVAKTATFVNESTSQSASGEAIYANVGSTSR